MIRLVTILLIAVFSAPAVSWGGALLPNGIDYLGTVSCCDTEDEREADEPREDT